MYTHKSKLERPSPDPKSSMSPKNEESLLEEKLLSKLKKLMMEMFTLIRLVVKKDTICKDIER